jgi:TPR repeat protein
MRRSLCKICPLIGRLQFMLRGAFHHIAACAALFLFGQSVTVPVGAAVPDNAIADSLSDGSAATPLTMPGDTIQSGQLVQERWLPLFARYFPLYEDKLAATREDLLKRQFGQSTREAIAEAGATIPDGMLATRQQAAANLEPDACYWLGLHHDAGVGLAQNDAQARDWYQLAANLGHADAQLMLVALDAEAQQEQQAPPEALINLAEGGDDRARQLLALYHVPDDTDGHVPDAQGRPGGDREQSARWFRALAESGDNEGKLGLAIHYIVGPVAGRGIYRDYGEASTLHEEAEAANLPAAYLLRGDMLMAGLAMRRHVNKAAEAYRKAATLGNNKGKFAIARAYLKGQGVPQSDQISLDWLREAAYDNYAPAMTTLGDIYSQGNIVTRDFDAARDWYDMAAQLDDAEGQYMLARIYLFGRREIRDEAVGMKWLTRAAEHGHADALLELGRRRSEAGDQQAAREAWQQAADKGNATAQRAVGLQYLHAEASDDELALGRRYLRLAEKQGHSPAIYDMARVYEEGIGVKVNPARAIARYRAAAAQNHMASQWQLGQIYELGKDVEQDVEEALLWYERAARNGLRPAMIKMFAAALDGQGMEADPKAARRWVGNAAAAGDHWARVVNAAMAATDYGTSSAEGFGATGAETDAENWKRQVISPLRRILAVGDISDNAAPYGWTESVFGEQLDSVDKAIKYPETLCLNDAPCLPVKALAWIEWLVEQGDPDAIVLLAQALIDGKGVEEDLPRALTLLEDLAETGNANAHSGLAQLYDKGIGVDASRRKALRHYRKAADAGHQEARYRLAALLYDDGEDELKTPEALEIWQSLAAEAHARSHYSLARVYLFGKGADTDLDRAIGHYEAAGAAGHREAYWQLAQLFTNGERMAVDQEKAADYLLKAAKQGHRQAQYNLARFLADGTGVARDDVEAAYWFRQAAQAGIGAAQYSLGRLRSLGRGVAQDHGLAHQWFMRAAEQGIVQAYLELGAQYYYGEGAAKDPVEALKWFILAADTDHATGVRNRDRVIGVTSADQQAEAQQRVDAWRAEQAGE